MSNQTENFACQCGHLAYKIPRRGWNCLCNNPRPKNGLSISQAVKEHKADMKRFYARLENQGANEVSQ